MSARQRALVVDDDAGIRILVSRILARKGFAVDCARDGAEAIEKILQHDYAVITLDLMMPRIDGAAVVRYLVEHQPAKLSNVIVMTAFGAAALDKVCPPVARFIEKPFDINALVTQALECSKAATAADGGASGLATEVNSVVAEANAERTAGS